uniref:Tumor suppressor candidate 5 n=1 Tax=Heterocephalus glaber TaxID=10181 RepID=A0A0P6IWV2_HETGA
MANPTHPQFSQAQELSSTLPQNLPEMEKLLTKVDSKDDKALNLSKSLSGAVDLEQNGHSLPFKVISEVHREASRPGSPSRASSRRASSIATTSFAQDQEAPKDYLVLAIASCFCPMWPLNLIPLIFSIMVSATFCSGSGAWPRVSSCVPRQAPNRLPQCKESPGAGSGGGEDPLLAPSFPFEGGPKG